MHNQIIKGNTLQHNNEPPTDVEGHYNKLDQLTRIYSHLFIF